MYFIKIVIFIWNKWTEFAVILNYYIYLHIFEFIYMYIYLLKNILFI